MIAEQFSYVQLQIDSAREQRELNIIRKHGNSALVALVDKIIEANEGKFPEHWRIEWAQQRTPKTRAKTKPKTRVRYFVVFELWLRGLIPRRDAEPHIVDGVKLYTLDQCELLIAPAKHHYQYHRPKSGAVPVCTEGRFALYRVSDCVLSVGRFCQILDRM